MKKKRFLQLRDKISMPALLLALLLGTGGLAWAQVGELNRNEPEKPFLKPYSPANDDQSLESSLDASPKTVKPDTKIIGKTAIKPDNIGKAPITDTLTRNSFSSYRKSDKMRNHPVGTKTGAAGNSPRLGGYDQSGGYGSTSFLDGYLLKSLHEDKIVTRKAREDNADNNNLKQNKKRPSSVK